MVAGKETKQFEPDENDIDRLEALRIKVAFASNGSRNSALRSFLKMCLLTHILRIYFI